MGLDMYLEKEIFIGAYFDHQEVTGEINVKIRGDAVPVNFDKVSRIVEQVGYWRKANAIHAWFVNNVQDGEDDCGRYYVTEEKMQELLEIVNKVLASSKLVDGLVVNGERWSVENEEWVPIFESGKFIEVASVAKELLPSQEGFFFGSTDYDQWYYEDLLLTKKILEAALAEPDADYYYRASW